MRKRKPIGEERASKLMHDLGLRTPEDIRRQFERLAAYGKLSQSATYGKTIGGEEMRVTVECVDLEQIDGNGNRCGACHNPIEPGQGVAFGRPQFTMPAINVCRRCVEVALALMSTGTIIIDVTRVKEGQLL